MPLINPEKLNLRVYPDPILKKVAEPFQLPLPENIEDIANRMLEIMYDHEGIGLAAPQAGFSQRMIVYDLGEEDSEDPQALINPEIIDSKKDLADGEEGCLSFPDIRADVARAQTITVRGINLEGQTIEFDCNDLPAIMFQHEIDHLNGINFVDRLQPTDKMIIKKQLAELESQYEPI